MGKEEEKREEEKKMKTGEEEEEKKAITKWECRIMDHGWRWGRVITVRRRFCVRDCYSGVYLITGITDSWYIALHSTEYGVYIWIYLLLYGVWNKYINMNAL